MASSLTPDDFYNLVDAMQNQENIEQQELTEKMTVKMMMSLQQLNSIMVDSFRFDSYMRWVKA